MQAEARREVPAATREALYGGAQALPERQPPRHLAVQINHGLQELLAKYPQSLLFGEDVAQKGGVHRHQDLLRRFGPRRVFNTLLDETMILGMAQGLANLGMLPIPEIQYLAYLHNAIDQVRGEACSLQFFSNDQFRNPMLVRVAGLGYQKGFGGHFHNDNSVTALRDIPGLVVGCPSRGDDAVMMLRTLAALARVDGRVAVFLEPIALYMSKDLHEAGDGQWLFDYPAQGQALVPGEGRVYAPEAGDLVIYTYGNGVPMALRARGPSSSSWAGRCGWSTCAGWYRWMPASSPPRPPARGGCWCWTKAATAAEWVRAWSRRWSRPAWVTCRCAGSVAPTPTRRWRGSNVRASSDNAVIGAALDLAQEP